VLRIAPWVALYSKKVKAKLANVTLSQLRGWAQARERAALASTP
jgi:hypothetical protein